LSFGSNIYSNSIFIHPNNLYILDGSIISTISDFNFLKFIPLFTFFFFISLLPFNIKKTEEYITTPTAAAPLKKEGSSYPDGSLENPSLNSEEIKIYEDKRSNYAIARMRV
jgi:hypothetical protein